MVPLFRFSVVTSLSSSLTLSTYSGQLLTLSRVLLSYNSSSTSSFSLRCLRCVLSPDTGSPSVTLGVTLIPERMRSHMYRPPGTPQLCNRSLKSFTIPFVRQPSLPPVSLRTGPTRPSFIPASSSRISGSGRISFRYPGQLFSDSSNGYPFYTPKMSHSPEGLFFLGIVYYITKFLCEVLHRLRYTDSGFGLFT